VKRASSPLPTRDWAAAPAGEAPGQSTAAGKSTIFFTVLLGALMGAIDTSIVNVALVRIQATYGVTTDEVAWVVTSYLITLVIVMPLTAWLSAVLGRKRFYLLSVALFTGASALCGMSRTLGQLLFFRCVQGLGGGAVRPIAQAIMWETFPQEERGQAMGLFGMIVLLGPAIGPALGGWLTDNYTWPWIFFVNLPVGAAALLLGMRFIEDPPYMRARPVERIDSVGIGLLAVGLAAFQIALQPPTNWLAAPPTLERKGLPFPNGNSYPPLKWATCRISKLQSP
jgi:DHA2 family multidrug resistance protein